MLIKLSNVFFQRSKLNTNDKYLEKHLKLWTQRNRHFYQNRFFVLILTKQFLKKFEEIFIENLYSRHIQFF